MALKMKLPRNIDFSEIYHSIQNFSSRIMRYNCRCLFSDSWYKVKYSSARGSDLGMHHYFSKGWSEGLSPHPLFSVKYYSQASGQFNSIEVEPVAHYLKTGSRANRNPHPLVDLEYYRSQLDTEIAGDALSHYLKKGWRYGLRITPSFNGDWYLTQYPDVKSADVEPLSHFLTWGYREGRRPTLEDDAETFLRRFNLLEEAEIARISASRELNGLPEIGVHPPRLLVEAPDYDRAATRAKEVFDVISAHSSASCGAIQLSGNEEQDESCDGGASKSGRKLPVDIVPSVLPKTEQRNHEFPILDRYNKYRLDICERLKLLPEHAGTVSDGPAISMLMPVYRTPEIFLERAILSVLCQKYANWRLIIVDDFSCSAGIDEILRYYCDLDSRITVISSPRNLGISAATNLALAEVETGYFGLIDHDDMLTGDALSLIAEVLEQRPDIDLLYSDECKIDENDIVDDLFAKPDWSPSLLFSCMYTGHFSVYRTELVRRIGGFRSAYDFSQDYDLALRVTDNPLEVHHIERYLYGWRMIEGSAAAGGKPTARISNVAALQDAALRRGIGGNALPLLHCNRLKRSMQSPEPLVSIVIPSDNMDNICDTIDSIEKFTEYRNIEIIVVTNTNIIKSAKNIKRFTKVKFAPFDTVYNFSEKCNVGAGSADGSYIIFFNDDVRVISPDWIESLLEYLTLEGVGVVGPKLLYENGTIQHAGMVTGVRRLVGTAFHTFPSDTSAHFSFAQSVREVSLICGACLAMPKEVFFSVGKFDPVNAGIAHSDVDLCFKVRDAGFRCVYVPFAELTHIGHLSIGAEDKSLKPFRRDKADIYCMKRWGQFLKRDPYFTAAMRDIVYIDSQEPFAFYPGKSMPEHSGPDVLIFSHDLSRSGAPRVVADMARVLMRSGAFVVVIAPEDGPMREVLSEMGAAVIIDKLALSGNQNVTDLGKNFDFIIANTIVCWRVFEQFEKFVPTYGYVHETELVQKFSTEVYDFRRSMAKARRLWVGSELSAGYLRRLELMVEPLILPYCVAPMPNAPRGKRLGLVQIAVLATIEPRKGQDFALEGYLAMPSEFRDRAHLRIAGRVNDRDFEESLHKMCEGAVGVSIEGELDFQEYQKSLMDADIIMCPSRDDTLPLVSLNALSAGKILVCSNEVGTSQYIENGVSGFVLESSRPEEVARVLSDIIEGIDDLDDVRSRAREVYENNFTERQFADRLSQALSEDFPDLALAIVKEHHFHEETK